MESMVLALLVVLMMSVASAEPSLHRATGRGHIAYILTGNGPCHQIVSINNDPPRERAIRTTFNNDRCFPCKHCLGASREIPLPTRLTREIRANAMAFVHVRKLMMLQRHTRTKTMTTQPKHMHT